MIRSSPLQPVLGRRLSKSARDAAWLLAGLGLVVQTTGCASRRPAPLLLEYQAPPQTVSNSAPSLNLKLVTYNIWGLPSWMTGAPRGRYPRIAGELERLNPDFILLQEAWTAKARKAAPADGHWSIARAAGQHGFFQQSGLMTLSKFEIIGGRFYPFSKAAFPDRFVNKGVLKVTVRLPDGQVLNVWNVHLQEGGPSEIRQSQVHQLVSRVQAAEDGQIADLVGGDFNCTPQSTLCGELEQSLGPSVQHLGGLEPFVTWEAFSAKPGTGQTIDHIFVRARSGCQEVQALPRVAFEAANRRQRLSDHFGIEVSVNLAPSIRLAATGEAPVRIPPSPAGAGRRVVLAGKD